MSIAYLKVGEVAARHKDKTGEHQTGEYQNAVAYQLYHALELFLKYAILKKNQSVGRTHDIGKLHSEYNGIYPKDEFRIEHPFDFSDYEPCALNIGEKQMYESHIATFKPNLMDQHLRYPPDTKTGGYSFSIDSETFILMRETFTDIYCKLNT